MHPRSVVGPPTVPHPTDASHGVVIMLLSMSLASSFVVSSKVLSIRRPSTRRPVQVDSMEHSWSPQDLTADLDGFVPLRDDDYVKLYQKNPKELWPVEFFLIAYRRVRHEQTGKLETQVLVRKSANGTSKWGVGTGVPVTRWMLSSQKEPPFGYTRSKQSTGAQEPIRFDAAHFPEFPTSGTHPSWTYDKIDIREDAFNGPDAIEFRDAELEEYASRIRKGLRRRLAQDMMDAHDMREWEASRMSLVKSILDDANSLAAIQGTLRMSGLFGLRKKASAGASPRYVSLGKDAPDHEKLVESMRIYTMFPQMPDPMPLPSTLPDELQEEIRSRDSRMAESGRDPHKDSHGRKYTHKSTSNVSNTIHGVYLTLDATDLPDLDEVPALDLFGTNQIKREWISLQELKVLDSDGKRISTEDTKPTFISGFIVRQLVVEGVVDIGHP